MNIQEAKKEISNTLRAYLAKDENGDYIYPLIRQRPVLLMGPPGIGKTAIMEQAAAECGVGLVAYTITHHTRQSAIGLPEIVKRNYGGREMTVTDYTMSEIVASVYDCMERTGKKEGILFIDEINCVSETLAPAMLALLQNKTFGSHKIPAGWVLAAAGNPPQYNKSVREFDIVTLDRVRRIEIEPDCDTWLQYAEEKQVHPAILAYLSMKKEKFYYVENTSEGKFFVTARGWEDLSRLLLSYEDLGIEVNRELIGEFLQKEETAGDFAAYYQLYSKYAQDYEIPQILHGTMEEEKRKEKEKMAGSGIFEERFAVIRLLLSTLKESMKKYKEEDEQITLLYETLLHLKKIWKNQEQISGMEEFVQKQKKSMEVKVQMELLTPKEQVCQQKVIDKLEEYMLNLKKEHISSAQEGFEKIKEYFTEEAEKRHILIRQIGEELENAFSFVKNSFGQSQEMLLFVSHLTADRDMTDFIAQNGCPSYFRYSRMLLGRQEEKELMQACKAVYSSSSDLKCV